MFVIMSTRENIRLIARCSLLFFSHKLTFMKDKSVTKNFAALTIILSGAKDADQYV